MRPRHRHRSRKPQRPSAADQSLARLAEGLAVSAERYERSVSELVHGASDGDAGFSDLPPSQDRSGVGVLRPAPTESAGRIAPPSESQAATILPGYRDDAQDRFLNQLSVSPDANIDMAPPDGILSAGARHSHSHATQPVAGPVVIGRGELTMPSLALRASAAAVPAPSRRPRRTRMSVALAVVAAGSACVGYAWPERVHRVAVDIRLTSDAPSTMAALRRCEEGLLQADVLRDASRRVGRGPTFFEEALSQETLRIERRLADRALRAMAAVPSEDLDAARQWLSAWVDTLESSRRARAASTEQSVEALRAARSAAQDALTRARSALQEANRALESDPTEAELRRLNAAVVDVRSRYETAQREAQAARLAYSREENMTEDDAARQVDERRLADVIASDDVLASDSQELAANAEVFQQDVLANDGAALPALARLGAAADSAAKELAAAISASGLADTGDLLDRVGRTLHEWATSASEYAGDWKSSMGLIRGWKPGAATGLLIEQHRVLRSGLTAFLRRTNERLGRVDAALDELTQSGDEMARRVTLRNALLRLVQPIRVAVEELFAVLDSLETTNDPQLDMIHRSIVLLGERTARRRSDLHEALRERLRQEWRESHQSQIAAARRAMDEAVARRESLAAQRDAAIEAYHAVLARTTRLDGRRHEVALRESEAQAAARTAAELDSRLADARREQREASVKDWEASAMIELARDRSTQVLRGAASAGGAVIVFLLIAELATAARARGGQRRR